MPISGDIEKKKITTAHGRYYLLRISAQRRKKIFIIQNVRRIKGIRTTPIKIEKAHITKKEALAILIGTQIGAGVLGLPYAASKVGLILAIGVLLGVTLLMMGTALIVLQFSAKMKGAQMSTMSQVILGRTGGILMYISISLMSFGALLAYISGMGSVISSLLKINETLGALLFWVLASIIVYKGIEASGKTELILSYIMLALFILVTIMLLPYVKLENGLYFESSGILSILGVSIFALGSHTIIPDIYKSLGSYKETKRVVILGFVIPATIYATFMSTFLLTFGKDTPQIATQGLEELYGKIGWIVGNLIPLLAITTSYIGISLAQQSNTIEFLKLKKPLAWSLTVIPPALVYFAGVKNFADVLAFAGDTGDLMAFIVLPILMWIVSKIKKIR
ncbi:aromatic amino acid transport family protein [Pyrococcus woesei]|uniref:aromatic amino acid transport family protein n=1 Tax=Pyrococcus woesei TaxID=2262 RepID=UPI003D2EF93D